jgi:hypothetical protein
MAGGGAGPGAGPGGTDADGPAGGDAGAPRDEGWADDTFDAGDLNTVAKLGMMPIVAWEPWDFSVLPKTDKLRGTQPKYRLSNIINGSFDTYIRSWAQGVSKLGYTVGIRFAHEMNGYWYPLVRTGQWKPAGRVRPHLAPRPRYFRGGGGDQRGVDLEPERQLPELDAARRAVPGRRVRGLGRLLRLLRNAEQRELQVV